MKNQQSRRVRDRSFRKRTRQSGRRRAAVVVEMAITLPVLFLILFASYEFSRASFLRHIAESAAYEGARRGIVPGAREADVRDAVESMLRAGWAEASTITVGPGRLDENAETIEVRVEVSMSQNTFFGKLFTKDLMLVGSCQLHREGFLGKR